MKLYSLRMEPAGPNGWASDELIFGEHITQLFGPNGCGKTPIIQSIAYALGYPVKYREDIIAHCDAAVLVLQTSKGDCELRRRIGPTFDVDVRIGDKPRSFFSEREYSQFLFQLFGFSFPALTTTGNEATVPYMATLLPVFYLDQDHGYSNAYKSPNTFIKDQYAEMMRLAFSLPPKNSFERKRLSIEKKKRLENVDRLIVKKREHIEQLTLELGKMRRPAQVVQGEIADVQASLERLKTSRSVKSDAQSSLDAMLYEKNAVRQNLLTEIAELKSRVNGFNSIQNEIEVEVNTLSLNEESRRLFSSFQDICATPSCGLFLSSSESYGKNLLYLRDQIKDLRRTMTNQNARIEMLSAQLSSTNHEVQAIENEQRNLTHRDEVSGLVDAISALTRNMIGLQKELTALEEIDADERTYIQLLNERKAIQDELASLDGSGDASDLRAIQVRTSLRERIRYWLDILQTKNVSREIAVETDFDTVFGGEKMAQIHGSTLLRVVLAIRTAAFDVYLQDPNKLLRFLLLDTPRQQDIEKEALARYVSELKALAAARNAQIVFSTSEYHYECADGDHEWSPLFPGPEQYMFLRETSKDRPS